MYSLSWIFPGAKDSVLLPHSSLRAPRQLHFSMESQGCTQRCLHYHLHPWPLGMEWNPTQFLISLEWRVSQHNSCCLGLLPVERWGIFACFGCLAGWRNPAAHSSGSARGSLQHWPLQWELSKAWTDPTKLSQLGERSLQGPSHHGLSGQGSWSWQQEVGDGILLREKWCSGSWLYLAFKWWLGMFST